MMKIFLTLSLLCFAQVSYSQGGCSDAGVCTLGGHSSERADTSHVFGAGIVQTYAATKDYSYFETIPSFSCDFDIIKAEISVLYRVAKAKYDLHGEAVTASQPVDPKQPAVQHVTTEKNVIPTHYAIGDAKLALTIPIRVIADGLRLNLGFTQPLSKLYEDRPQEMQSTLGLSSLLLGMSLDGGDNKFSYGGTVAYQTTFSKENALHMVRADDAALALRMKAELTRFYSGGLDMSAIYHLDEDRLHHEPTSRIQGYETTKGLTINLGGSVTRSLSDAMSFGIYAAAPIVSIAHVDGLKRNFVSALFFTYGWR